MSSSVFIAQLVDNERKIFLPMLILVFTLQLCLVGENTKQKSSSIKFILIQGHV